MLQQGACSALRRKYLRSIRFNSISCCTYRGTENLDSSPYLAAWKKPQFLFTDRTPCRQRAGLSIYYMKTECQNPLNSGPVGQLLGVIEAIIIHNKKIAALRVQPSKPWNRRIPFSQLYQLKNSGQENYSIPQIM